MNDSAAESSPVIQYGGIDVTDDFLWLAGTAVAVIFFPVIYKKVRCKLPTAVNCWFCNKYTWVPYNDANCWDCPFCEQYNGFNKDGGYNKEIKEQHSPALNSQLFATSARVGCKSDTRGTISSNGLCKLCNINQQLKIQQLARFVPLNEKNYDVEVERFRQQLEKCYRLCSQCERTLSETLKSQQYNLLKGRLNVQRDANQIGKRSSSSNFSLWYNYKLVLQMLGKVLCSGLRLISGTISFVMFISFICQFETEIGFLKGILPEAFVVDFHTVLQELLDSLRYSYKVKKELITIGLLCHALSSFNRPAFHDHPSLLLFWGILYTLSWTEMTGLQIFASGVCVLLSIFEFRKPPSYSLKKLPRSQTVEAEEPGASEEKRPRPKPQHQSRQEPEPEEKQSSNESEEIVSLLDVDKAEEQRERTTPSPLKKPTSPPPKKPVGEATARVRSVFNKEFLATLDSAQVEKELSPAPEIFRHLNNLHIGNGPVGAAEKPSNFLFENRNLEERCKKGSSIIRSPRFKYSPPQPPPSWSANGGDVHESISRSSTPSSGYSSQKAEKLGGFHFPKSISPVAFSPPRSDAFDLCDRSHPCFPPGNYPYFSPGCVPFQQFSNPLPHATLCACARSPGCPFAFSPGPFSPSTRFSDASESENLFHNASSNLNSSRRWSNIKSFLYNLSVFVNVVTSCVLAYFAWSGIISLSGN